MLSSLYRKIRLWEYWPIAIFYTPIVLWCLLLSIGYRKLFPFTAVNPCMKTSGLIEEDKAKVLVQLQKNAPEVVAITNVFNNADKAGILAAMTNHNLTFPIVLKPNGGKRGLGVEVIKNVNHLDNYLLSNGNRPLILQEHIVGVEFGVFYMREPNKPSGWIFSICEKTFPKVTGDGINNLKQLIMANPDFLPMAHVYCESNIELLETVLNKDQLHQLIHIGTHSRGSVFLEAKRHITPALQRQIDRISKHINGFYFGRYDIRVPSIEDLEQGVNIKVLEVNGASSESANIYHPGTSLLSAYKIMFKQWHWAYKIGVANCKKGIRPSSVSEIRQALSRMNR